MIIILSFFQGHRSPTFLRYQHIILIVIGGPTTIILASFPEGTRTLAQELFLVTSVSHLDTVNLDSSSSPEEPSFSLEVTSVGPPPSSATQSDFGSSPIDDPIELEKFDRFKSSITRQKPSVSPTQPRNTSAMAYQRTGPDFVFCGTFSGKGDISASKWLKKFEYEMAGYKNNNVIPADRYLSAIELLLVEEASVWSETDLDVAGWLAEENPTQNTVTLFKTRFIQKYPARLAESAPFNFDAEMADLRQGPEETLLMYYRRTLGSLQRVGGRDRPLVPSPENPMLSSLESVTLDTVIRSFVRGISDIDVKREAIRGSSVLSRSLQGTYNVAEEARRSKLEFAKVKEEEDRQHELEFLRKVVSQNLPPQQVEVLRTNYSTQSNQPHLWGFQPNYNLGAISEPQPPRYSHSPRRNPPSFEIHQPHESPEPNSACPPQFNANPSPHATSSNRVPLGERQAPANKSYQGNDQNRPNDWERNRGGPVSSGNGYVNGTMTWAKGDGPLCFKCGNAGHMSYNCTGVPLQYWEQDILKGKVFGDKQRDRQQGPPRSTSAPQSTAPMNTPTSSASVPVTARMASLSMDEAHLPMSSQEPVNVNSLSLGFTSSQNLEAHSSGLDMDRPSSSTPTIESFLGEGSGPNKRARPDDTQQSSTTLPGQSAPLSDPPALDPQQAHQTGDPDPAYQSPYSFVFNRPKAAMRTPRKGTKRTPKAIELNPIVGMMNEKTGVAHPSISVREVLSKVPSNMSIMELCYWSPSFSRELKRMVTRVTKKKGKQAKDPVVEAQSLLVEHNSDLLQAMIKLDKAFRVPCTLRIPSGKDGTTKDVEIPKSRVQADQGSEMNVISHTLARDLGLEFHTLESIGFAGLTMRTADNREAPLTYWVSLIVGVAGLWRDIQCFIGPIYADRNYTITSVGLLLGLPWLFNVNAVMTIRGSQIEIGDAALGEERRSIVGPQMVFSQKHQLVMYPKSLTSPPVHQEEGQKDEPLSDSSDESSVELSDDSDSGN